MSKNNHEQGYTRENYEHKQEELASLDEQAAQRLTEINAQYAEKLDVYDQLRKEDGETMVNDPELAEEEQNLIQERDNLRENLVSPINKEITRAKAELTNLYVKGWNEASREESKREHLKALPEVKKIHAHLMESSNLLETSYGRLQSMIREAGCIATELEEMLSDPHYTNDSDEEQIKELAQALLEINGIIEEETSRLRGHRRGESRDDLN